MKNQYLPIDVLCRHCDGGLSARLKEKQESVIDGLLDLDYTHTKNHRKECIVTYRASPYNPWEGSREYKKNRNAKEQQHE